MKLFEQVIVEFMLHIGQVIAWWGRRDLDPVACGNVLVLAIDITEQTMKLHYDTATTQFIYDCRFSARTPNTV